MCARVRLALRAPRIGLHMSGMFASERGQMFLMRARQVLWTTRQGVRVEELRTWDKEDVARRVRVDDAFRDDLQLLYGRFAHEYGVRGRPPSCNTFLLYFLRAVGGHERATVLDTGASLADEAVVCMDAVRQAFFAICHHRVPSYAAQRPASLASSGLRAGSARAASPRSHDGARDDASCVDTTIHPDDSVSNIGSSGGDQRPRAPPGGADDVISVAFSHRSAARRTAPNPPGPLRARHGHTTTPGGVRGSSDASFVTRS